MTSRKVLATFSREGRGDGRGDGPGGDGAGAHRHAGGGNAAFGITALATVPVPS